MREAPWDDGATRRRAQWRHASHRDISGRFPSPTRQAGEGQRARAPLEATLMGMEIWLVLAVLAGAVVLFVTEKLPVDVVALLVLSSLLVLGLVTPREALSGFSSQATITVAAMFVLSAGLQRSGALLVVGEALARIKWSWLFALVMMGLVAFVSAFVNNTAAVAVFLPLVIATAVARKRSPSKFLIPLSYAAQFGGVCTLVGTSTNLLVDTLARQFGREGFGLFEFAPLGVIFVGVGIVYVLFAQRFLLPDLGVPDSGDSGHGSGWLTELMVSERSPAIGQRAAEALPEGLHDTHLLEVIRNRQRLPAPLSEVLQAGDRLLLRGNWEQLDAVRKQLKLDFEPAAVGYDGAHPGEERIHAEIMIAPGSHLAGHSLSSMRFVHTYRARVHGLQRSRGLLRNALDEIPLMVGDVMLVDTSEKSLAALRREPGLVVLGQRAQQRVDWRRASVSALILAAVIGTAGVGLLPIVASALLGCVALVVFRCLDTDEAYAAIDWRVIVLLAGVLPLGIALQNSGGAEWMAQQAIKVIGPFGPVATLAAIYLLTAVMTEVMSNNAAGVLVVPIAIAAADSLGVDAKPMLVAVAFAASTSFATPVGYQTNTMVYTAGGYRFVDFIKIGLPLNLIFWIMAIMLIPLYFPFHAA
jgi:di/tricarboxylate transporter